MTQSDINRMMYREMRINTKSPPVLHTKLSKDMRVCTVKGTRFEVTYDGGFQDTWTDKMNCLMAYREHIGSHL